MLKALNWMSINQRIKYNVLVMIFKMIKGLLPKYLSDNLIFTNEIHNVRTRQENQLRIPKFNTEFARKNVFVIGLKMYNDLPKNIKESNSLNQFKQKCSEYVMLNVDSLLDKKNR